MSGNSEGTPAPNDDVIIFTDHKISTSRVFTQDLNRWINNNLKTIPKKNLFERYTK